MKKKQKILIPGIICFFASSFYIYDYIIRVMPAGMAHALMTGFNIHAGQLGILSSLFFWGYMPMQIPVGLFFDKFSARSLLAITLLLSSLFVLYWNGIIFVGDMLLCHTLFHSLFLVLFLVLFHCI